MTTTADENSGIDHNFGIEAKSTVISTFNALIGTLMRVFRLSGLAESHVLIL